MRWNNLLSWVCAFMAFGLSTATARAGPSWLIKKPPVVSGTDPNTGPPGDPTASQGQWFSGVGGLEQSRPFEFYDNVLGEGGGAASTDAIRGVLAGSTIDPNGNVSAFSILASITNDLATLSGTPLPGDNSHGESVGVQQSYVGTLFATKLTASFADSGAGTSGSNIFAVDHDQLAWSSFTSTGAYQVPTWDFGDIALGQTVSRILNFGFFNPLSQADFNLLVPADSDLFLNRTTSLKISDYPDSLTPDNGLAYPVPPLRSSDVSVFHAVPEPGSVTLLALGAIGLIGASRARRRR